MRFAWLTLFLAVTACSKGVETSAAADGGPTPAPGETATPYPTATPGPGVSDPAQPGPWLAGVRTLELSDPSRSRTIPVDVWYPVETGGQANTYVLDSPLGELASIDSPARRDAPPASGGPWPVVVFSHGFGGIRFQSFFLTEWLATHGYVVIAPDHPGNTLADTFLLGNDEAVAQSAIDRPLDVVFSADALLAGLEGLALDVDPAHMAVSGHSFGGWTALEVARTDPRFGVVFPLAPGFKAGATPDFVATLDRPLAIFGGSLDDTCEFATDQQAPYDLAQTPKHLVKVLGAGHLDFSNLCDVPLAVLFVNDGCNAENVEPAIVQDRTKVIAAAFLGRYLQGNEGYEPYLQQAWVEGLGNNEYSRSAP